jgi:hypothetical protein
MVRVLASTPLMATVGLRRGFDGAGELRHKGGISRF